MSSKKEKVRVIIHGAATASAAAGAGMAQVPTSDSVVIAPIQIGMVIGIGSVYGHSVTQTEALGIIAAAGAVGIGRKISQILVGWIPLWGNMTNASTAFALTEAVGWGAYKILRKG